MQQKVASRESQQTNFFREFQDFAGDQETCGIFRATRSNKVKILRVLRFFGNVFQTSGRYSKFSGGRLLQVQSAQTAFVRAVPSPPP